MKLPHLLTERTRHGRTVYYVRLGAGPRVRVRGEPGRPGFAAAYEAALQVLATNEPAPSPRVPPGSLAHAVALYRASASVQQLTPPTRRRHLRLLDRIAAEFTDKRPDDIEPATLRQVLGALQPHAARHLHQTLRRFYGWAVDHGVADLNPMAGVKRPRTPRTDGFTPWTVAQVAAFRARWPVGTAARMTLELVLNTLARRGDLVRIGRQHIAGGRIRFAPAKTARSSAVVVDVPVLPSLAACIAAMPASADLALIQTQAGRAVASGAALGNHWADWTEAAGITGMTLHGARKLGAELLAEAGATVPEMMACLGHTSPAQAMLYAAKANRAKLADAAMARIKS